MQLPGTPNDSLYMNFFTQNYQLSERNRNLYEDRSQYSNLSLTAPRGIRMYFRAIVYGSSPAYSFSIPDKVVYAKLHLTIN